MEYISNALSPAKIQEITLDEPSKTATAKVNEDQLSLAIGKAGQNVRLAARLTGWKIDIISSGKKAEEVEAAAEPTENDAAAKPVETEEKEVSKWTS